MRPAQRAFQRGFTLIELLIVISIIAIITGAAIPSFTQYIDSQNVRQAQEQVKDDIRTIQNRALNGQDSTEMIGSDRVEYWGIRFTNGQTRYSYFKSTNTSACSGGTTVNYRDSEPLPGGNVVRNNSGCIFFSFENGDAVFSWAGADNVIVGPPSGGSGCKRVVLNSYGLIQTNTSNESCAL